MKKKSVKIRDLTLRDGQQSLFATRMPISQIRQVMPIIKNAGFYAAEVWGGAVPDSCMRYLDENPWERLREIAKLNENKLHLTALSRGRNLFGYNPYPDSVIKKFVTNAIENGITILRIFDALNDVNNLKTTIEACKEAGGLADVAFSFTTDPKVKAGTLSLSKYKKQTKQVFNVDYWVKFAKEVEKMGADLITIKDMAGLLTPENAANLVPALKDAVSIPIDLHTHCTPGYGLTTAVISMMKGVDIIDTAIFSFSSGSAAPSIELLRLFADYLDIETGVKLSEVVKANKLLKKFRNEFRENGLDSYPDAPIDFPAITAEMSGLVENTVKLLDTNRFNEATEAVHKLEKMIGLPAPDFGVRDAQIPGGMYTNLLKQLKDANLEHALKNVLEEVPIVRLDSGLPPLVTPTSQIVGVQAVQNVKDIFAKTPRYSHLTGQFVNMVKGLYGKTPVEITPDFRKKITGSEEEEVFDPLTFEPQKIDEIPEIGRKVAENEEEELLVELFPMIAKTFLKNRKIKQFNDEQDELYENNIKANDKEFVRMLDGLAGNYLPENNDDIDEPFEQK